MSAAADTLLDELSAEASATALAPPAASRRRRSFVHLSLHSEFSLVDSTIRVKALAKAVAAGMPAVAVTDRGNMFSLVKFYRAALAAGVKPIAGVDVRISETPIHGATGLAARGGGRASDAAPARAHLLAMDERGHLNLTQLVSRGYQEGQVDGRPLLEASWVEAAHEGLIMLSGGLEGELGIACRRGRPEEAETAALRWRRVFGDRYYLELARTGREGEEEHVACACAIAARHGIPVVAVNDVRFLARADHANHEARVCIQSGHVLADPRRPKTVSEEQYLKSTEEMEALFADLPVALDNTIEVARRCNLVLKLGKPVLPDFPIPDGMTETEFFYRSAAEGLETRLSKLYDRAAPGFAKIREPYDARLRRELDVIAGMGFPGYFLIVADFIRWARENDVPVGPGRGSGAGSLVAYALTITDIDPLQYDLLFERFLNPERVSMPDFDIDFCMDGRDRVIQYVAEKYGRHRVSQIVTYGTMAAKAVVRDVGRVMSHAYGFVDRLAKMVPFEVGMTLEKAMRDSEELAEAYRSDEEVTAVIDMARFLEGLSRNCGKHAGGVVIAPTALTDFSPLYCEPDGSNLVTQFDKDDAEDVGLVKFDFLGLKTLTIIANAVKAIDAYAMPRGDGPLDLMALPLDDPGTYELLQKAQTTSVFQLESGGIKRLVERLKPDNFEDIIALVALYRPGPLQSGMVDDFIDRKHGRKKMAWPHEDYQLESLRPILEPTYGVILYQEQVMGIAQTMAGFSLGTADILRRAMGKKKPEEMAKQRQGFLDGCAANGVDVALAGNIFDLVEKFAGYGFNKSHSAAYALLSYQTAWLKRHHPAAFMASVLSADADLTDKVVIQYEECLALGLAVRPPDVNRSAIRFAAADEGTVLWGLGAIKGVGAGVLAEIVTARDADGPFASLEALCRRVPRGTLNKRVLEALVRAGACDALGPNRRTLFERVPDALAGGDRFHRDRDAGQVDLFGEPAPDEAASDEAARDDVAPDEASAHDVAPHEARVDVRDGAFRALPEWPERQRLAAERDTLGTYLSGHPFNEFKAELGHMSHGSLRDICDKAGRDAGGGGGQWKRAPATSAIGAGLVTGVRQRDGHGGRMLIVQLDDGSGRLEAVLRGELIERAGPLVKRDELLVVEGEVSFDDFSGGHRMKVREVMDLAAARSRFARRLLVKLDGRRLERGTLDALVGILEEYKGGTVPLILHWRNDAAEARAAAGRRWAVKPDERLLDALGELLGKEHVRLLYGA